MTINFGGTLRSVTVKGIVHEMPAGEYSSVKMSLEVWYDHFMICPIGSLSIFKMFLQA
jgi:hypothetical protein